MTRDQIEHAIRAACDVSNDTELWIFGSQALLGEFPDAPKSLRASIEVDIQPKNRPETVDNIDGSLGEFSMFHQTHGFYVHGISIEAALLPVGWGRRTTSIRDPVKTNNNTGLCIEVRSCGQQACRLQGKTTKNLTTYFLSNYVNAVVLGIVGICRQSCRINYSKSIASRGIRRLPTGQPHPRLSTSPGYPGPCLPQR